MEHLSLSQRKVRVATKAKAGLSNWWPMRGTYEAPRLSPSYCSPTALATTEARVSRHPFPPLAPPQVAEQCRELRVSPGHTGSGGKFRTVPEVGGVGRGVRVTQRSEVEHLHYTLASGP